MWNSLLSDDTKLIAEKQALEEELASKESMIKYILEENHKLKSDNEILEYTKQSNFAKLADNEKVRLHLQKAAQKAQENLKYELIAREGLVKKSNIMELDNIALKEEKQNLLSAQKLASHRQKELETALNDERVKRLKDIHEIDLLKKENAKLLKESQSASADALTANSSLLLGLERTETLLAQKQMQERILTAQGEEAASMLSEITKLKEEQRRLHKDVQGLTTQLRERTKQCEDLQQEVWRLSKEVLEGSITQGGKDRAFRPTLSQAKEQTLRSEMDRRHHGDGLNDSFGTCSYDSLASPGSSVLSLVYAKQSTAAGRLLGTDLIRSDSLTGTGTSPHSSQSPYKGASGNSPLGELSHFNIASRRAHRLEDNNTNKETSSVSNNNSNRYSAGVKSPIKKQKSRESLKYLDRGERGERGGNEQGEKDQESSFAKTTGSIKALQELSCRPKTTFVGNGLGLRKDTVVFESKGSTKEVLKNVLLERGLL